LEAAYQSLLTGHELTLQPSECRVGEALGDRKFSVLRPRKTLSTA
jgi:hypothetical protein